MKKFARFNKRMDFNKTIGPGKNNRLINIGPMFVLFQEKEQGRKSKYNGNSEIFRYQSQLQPFMVCIYKLSMCREIKMSLNF